MKIDLLNGKLSDRTFNLSYLKDFISNYESAASNWDRNQIRLRAEHLAKQAYSDIWKID
jgi:hypothetical protein